MLQDFQECPNLQSTSISKRGRDPKSAWLSRSGPAHGKCKGVLWSTKSWSVCASCRRLYPHTGETLSWGNEPFPKGPSQVGLPALHSNPCSQLQEKPVYSKKTPFFFMATWGRERERDGETIPQGFPRKIVPPTTPNDILIHF